MDLEVIDMIFTFGKFVALTPSSTNNHNPHCLQKLYEICVYLLYIVGFIASAYAKSPVYQALTSVQFVLAALRDLNQFCFIFYILIVMMRLKRSRWLRLIKSVAGVKSAPKKIPLKLIFVASQLVYFSLTTFGVYTYIADAGLTVAAFYIGEFYQHYAQFFYVVFTTILLILLLSRYERLSETLSQLIRARSQLNSKQVVDILQKIKNSVFTLKEGVEVFNDIFGWSILFTIFYCVSGTLVYIDTVIKHNEIWEGRNALVFYRDLCRILISWVKQFTCPFCDVTPL
jgi:gustatory receptor